MGYFKHKITVVKEEPTTVDKIIKGMTLAKAALSLYSTYLITKEIIRNVKEHVVVNVVVRKDIDEVEGE